MKTKKIILREITKRKFYKSYLPWTVVLFNAIFLLFPVFFVFYVIPKITFFAPIFEGAFTLKDLRQQSINLMSTRKRKNESHILQDAAGIPHASQKYRQIIVRD